MCGSVRKKASWQERALTFALKYRAKYVKKKIMIFQIWVEYQQRYKVRKKHDDHREQEPTWEGVKQ